VLHVPVTADQLPLARQVELTWPKRDSHTTLQTWPGSKPLQLVVMAPSASGTPLQLTAKVFTAGADRADRRMSMACYVMV
jgi:hypothetical protein